MILAGSMVSGVGASAVDVGASAVGDVGADASTDLKCHLKTGLQ